MEKKMYQVPCIKVRKVETAGPLAMSLSGDTGIRKGEGPPPTEADAKRFDFSFESNESSESSNLWTEE